MQFGRSSTETCLIGDDTVLYQVRGASMQNQLTVGQRPYPHGPGPGTPAQPCQLLPSGRYRGRVLRAARRCRHTTSRVRSSCPTRQPAQQISCEQHFSRTKCLPGARRARYAACRKPASTKPSRRWFLRSTHIDVFFIEFENGQSGWSRQGGLPSPDPCRAGDGDVDIKAQPLVVVRLPRPTAPGPPVASSTNFAASSWRCRSTPRNPARTAPQASDLLARAGQDRIDAENTAIETGVAERRPRRWQRSCSRCSGRRRIE